MSARRAVVARAGRAGTVSIRLLAPTVPTAEAGTEIAKRFARKRRDP